MYYFYKSIIPNDTVWRDGNFGRYIDIAATAAGIGKRPALAYLILIRKDGGGLLEESCGLTHALHELHHVGFFAPQRRNQLLNFSADFP